MEKVNCLFLNFNVKSFFEKRQRCSFVLYKSHPVTIVTGLQIDNLSRKQQCPSILSRIRPWSNLRFYCKLNDIRWLTVNKVSAYQIAFCAHVPRWSGWLCGLRKYFFARFQRASFKEFHSSLAIVNRLWYIFGKGLFAFYWVLNDISLNISFVHFVEFDYTNKTRGENGLLVTADNAINVVFFVLRNAKILSIQTVQKSMILRSWCKFLAKIPSNC